MTKQEIPETIKIIDFVSKASELAVQGNDWKKLVGSINNSISLGVSADYNAIYWQNSDLSTFNAVTEIGDSKWQEKTLLEVNKIPTNWIKKKTFKTLLSNSNSSQKTKLLKELKRNNFTAMIVPISVGKDLKGFIFSQQKGNQNFVQSDIRFVESMASILALAHEKEIHKKSSKDLENLSLVNPDLIMKFNIDNELLYYNPAVSNLLDSLKINIKDLSTILPSNHNKRLDLAYKKGQNLTAESLVGDRYYKFQYIPLLDDELLIVFGKDVTDRHEAMNNLLHSQSRLIESNEALKELYEREKQIRSQLIHTEQLAALGQMGSKIAHELNNPLQVISACAEVISDMVEDDSVNEIVDDMNIEIQHIISLASGYMKLGKPSASKRKNLNVNIILKELLKTFDAIGQLKSVNINLNLGKRLPNVNVNKDKLDQVYRNLILNALQAMQGKKTQNLTIITHADKKSGFVITEIVDSGVGILKKNLKRIFDPYFTTKEEYAGTGIGLLIVKDIIESEYSGRINVESALNIGTTFKIALPIVIEEQYSPKILIVDDEPMLCHSYQSYLSRSGYEVKTAINAKDGLKLTDSFKPDVIIADIQMPKMDGFQFAETIWKTNPQQKIIFSSGFAYVDDINNRLEKDNLQFFKKPARLVEDLLFNVEKALKE